MSADENTNVRIGDTVQFAGWYWKTQWTFRDGEQIKTGREQVRRSFPAIVVGIGDWRTKRPYKLVDADGKGLPQTRSWFLAALGEITKEVGE